MKFPQDPKEKKAAIIAACVTSGAALVIIVLLFVLSIGGGRMEMAQDSMAANTSPEEIYLEPEFLDAELLDTDNLDSREGMDIGEDNADEPAPQPEGEPEEGEPEDLRSKPNDEKPVETPKPDAQPAKSAVNNPATNTESGANTSQDTDAGKKDNEITDAIKDKLKKTNGSSTGKNTTTSGTGGEGLSFSYEGVGGRTMESYTKVDVASSTNVPIKVKIVVNAEGNVVGEPEVISGGNKDQRKACVKMAKSSKWTPQPGAKDVVGFITFTLTPKK